MYFLLRFCCTGYNTLQNFGLHPILEPSLNFYWMSASTRAQPVSLCWVFAPSLLDHSTGIFLHVGNNVTLAATIWSCTRSRFMCTSCIRYVNICLTHTQSCMHYHASLIVVVQQSIISVVLVARTVGRSRWVYVVLMVWGILSSCQVCVRKVTYAQIHSLTHLVILLKF